MKLGAKIFGTLAGLSGLFLFVGFLLPGSWSAQVSTTLPGPPWEVFPYFNTTSLWSLWNRMPDAGVELLGIESGIGAGLRWDDPQYGSGEARILESDPPTSLTYEVVVEGGTIRIRGSVGLSPTPGGTLVTWREEGDFGQNPLLGYAALGMSESQSQAMAAGLNGLEGHMRSGSDSTPLP